MKLPVCVVLWSPSDIEGPVVIEFEVCGGPVVGGLPEFEDKKVVVKTDPSLVNVDVTGCCDEVVVPGFEDKKVVVKIDPPLVNVDVTGCCEVLDLDVETEDELVAGDTG